MSGTATRENTAAVAVEAPDTAAKPALANTVATARPPGNPADPAARGFEEPSGEAGVEREKPDQDEERQDGERVRDRLRMGDRAGDGARDAPALELQQPEEGPSAPAAT